MECNDNSNVISITTLIIIIISGQSAIPVLLRASPSSYLHNPVYMEKIIVKIRPNQIPLVHSPSTHLTRAMVWLSVRLSASVLSRHCWSWLHTTAAGVGWGLGAGAGGRVLTDMVRSSH